MMNRRHFLGTAGIALAGSMFAGPLRWSGRHESRIMVILTGGIWHENTQASDHWKIFTSGGQRFRRPVFGGRKVKGEFGLDIRSFGDGLASQLKSFGEKYWGHETVELVINGDIHHWRAGGADDFPLPAHGWEADAKSLSVPLSSSGLSRVILLHGTDVAHFDMAKYLEVEEHLGKALRTYSNQWREKGRSMSLVCLHGRDAQPNAMGGLDHASQAALQGGWWLEIA